MDDKLSAAAKRVQDALNEKGVQLTVIELEQSTRTADEAAGAVGCAVGQIAKSLLFQGKKTGAPYLVIASGANRVNVKRLAEAVQEPVAMPRADFVRETTGFAIGGVPPVGHATALATFIDEDLLGHEAIWAAAGTPNAMFCLTPDDLVRITAGTVVPIR